jgi:predicted glycogen debranching enzyme
LITAGSQRTQLTWMDAACDGTIFTPRAGKAVEINALWYHVLTGMAEMLGDGNKSTADHYRKLTARISRAFSRLFWDEEQGYLYDHAWTDDQGQEQIDRTCRPNQILAVSLPHSPLPRKRQQQVFDMVRRRLFTPVGLRTLPADDARYHGHYQGTLYARDEAYHQGTVWPWLMGPYAEAILRLGRFSPAARAEAQGAIRGLVDQMLGPGLGQLHEICDGDPPHQPRGCIAQAWSVAEVIRVMALIARPAKT